MATLREIKRRISSVQNTKKITSAMKIVAATKLKRCEKHAIGSRPFFEHIENMLADLQGAGMGVEHPYLLPRKAKKILILVVTSDRGLCGAFNSVLTRKVYEIAKEERAQGKEIQFYVMGLKGLRFFNSKGEKVFKSLVGIDRKPKVECARETSRELAQIFIEEQADEIRVAYNGFLSRASYETRIQPFLPISIPRDQKKERSQKESSSGYFEFEPSNEAVLKFLFPLYLEAKVYRALIESEAAEEAARVQAMDYATENASEMIQDLTLLYNRARQAGITKEISEIVGGAEALK